MKKFILFFVSILFVASPFVALADDDEQTPPPPPQEEIVFGNHYQIQILGSLTLRILSINLLRESIMMVVFG